MFFRSKAGGVQWLLVFLGNPGPKYTGTRHNAGFQAGDAVAKRCGVNISRLKCRALTAQAELGGQRVLLVKPQTFMNLSGEAVRPLADFYKIAPNRILVVSDEMALPPGTLRLRAGGSAGGHNGLKNIIQQLGTEEFPRLRIGVGEPPYADYDRADWALSVMRNEDAVSVADTCSRAVSAIECVLEHGISQAMSRYNGSSI